MKLNFTRTALLFAIVIAFYTSCKKSDTSPAATTNYDTAGKQVTLNLMSGLSGAYGGANINDGSAAQQIVTASYGTQLSIKKVPLCGYTIDTTYTKNVKILDTSKTYLGYFKFIYTCSAFRLDGYTVNDSLVTLANSPVAKNKFTVSQNYVVKALDSTYKLVSTNGSILSITDNQIYRDGFSVGFDYNYFRYRLSNLKIDFSSGVADIISGTAYFTSTMSYMHYGEDKTTELSLSGTLQFLGGHKATLFIKQQNKSYTVNLTTGSVTPN